MRKNLNEAETKNQDLIKQIENLKSEALNKNGSTASVKDASTNVQLKNSTQAFFTVNLCSFQGLKSNDVRVESNTVKYTG